MPILSDLRWIGAVARLLLYIVLLGSTACAEGSAGPNPDPPPEPGDFELSSADPAAVGDTTRLYGRGFVRPPGANLVRFTNVDPDALPVAAERVFEAGGEQVLEVMVPDGTQTGPVTVIVNGVESNPVPFVLIIPVGYAPYEVRFLPSPQGHLRALCASLGDPTIREGDDSSLSIIDVDLESAGFGRRIVKLDEIGLEVTTVPILSPDAGEGVKAGPAALVVSPARNRGYLAAEKTDEILVVDPAPDCPAGAEDRDCYVTRVIGAADGLDVGPENLALTASGAFLLVGHDGADRVTVLDTSKMEPGSEDPGGPVHHAFSCIPNPLGIGVHPERERAYVGRRQLITLFPEPCEGRDLSDPETGTSILFESVDVLDLEGDGGPSFAGTVPLVHLGRFPFLFNDPEKIVLTPDGKRAYVELQDTWAVGVVGTDPDDPETYHVLYEIIRVGRRPVDIVIRPQGDFAFVAHGGTDRREVWSADCVSVVEIGGPNDNRAFTIPDVGLGPAELELSPDGNRLYVPVSDFGEDPKIQVIDTDPGSESFARIVETIRLPGDRFADFPPWKVRISPDGRFAIVIPGYLPPPKPGDPWDAPFFLDHLVMLPLE